jgi:hypothetical protein
MKLGRACLTQRARRWTLQQIGDADRDVASVARQLGVGWHTVMRIVTELGTRRSTTPPAWTG